METHPGDDEFGWIDSKDVIAEYLGKAKQGIKPGVICASFNAG